VICDQERIPAAGGKSYYFFWSLERIAVALNLTTIGKKDWYNWGAEIILANQGTDGMWTGEHFELLRRHLFRAIVPETIESGLRSRRQTCRITRSG
jgi:hypothetical protein